QRLPLGDPEEIPAGSLSGQADEDFWWNPVPPQAASIYQRLPLGDPEELPAGSLFGKPDEDFWSNLVAPVAASNWWPQQFTFDVQEPAGQLFGQYDEDFWQGQVQPAIPANQLLPYFFDAGELATPVLITEEVGQELVGGDCGLNLDRKSTRLNSS